MTYSFDGMTYLVKTFGCQMNKHDTERVESMLDSRKMQRVEREELADVIVFLTCCVREAADTRLMGQVASLKNVPAPHGKRIIAVGGCIGQRDGEKLIDTLGHVDIVFGTHNVDELPALLEETLQAHQACVSLRDHSETANYEIPFHREHSFHAWLPIMKGCNNFCTYCIVPYVRGREISRPFEEIIREAEILVSDGVKEITLLGQNVNSYGRDLYGAPRFADILRRVGETGIQRLRFATSHPKDLSDETIAAFAETPACMPQLHLPVQSGSDRILKAMNRNYTVSHYLSLVEKMRYALPDISFSTDLIVGFPGENEEDFKATLELVRTVGYGQTFTFIYSKRAGTPAADLLDSTSASVIQERFNRLVEVVQESAYTQNLKELNQVVDVLIEGTSKRDATMLTGKTPKNQTVHMPLPEDVSIDDMVGHIIPVKIEETRTWYLRGHGIEMA